MHKLKRHIWNEIDGRMATEERYFHTLADAIKHLEESVFHKFKIYDENENLVHSGSKEDFANYA